MAFYTTTAYKWNGYSSGYEVSHTAVFEDNDPHSDGDSDADERVSIDGGAQRGTIGTSHSIKISFVPAGGSTLEIEEFFFFHNGLSWYFVPGAGSNFTVDSYLANPPVYQTSGLAWRYDQVTCFARSTLIETDVGQKPVEDLRQGDLLRTSDGRWVNLRVALSRKVSGFDLRREPCLRPITITAGSLGQGLPLRDLRVSRQHRMLVSSAIVMRMFGQNETLVAAIHLTRLPGVFITPMDQLEDGVEYFHLLLDQHQILLAEGAPSESLLATPNALSGLLEEGQKEVLALFPQLLDSDYQPKPALPLAQASRQKQLISRHIQNEKPILTSF